MIYRFNIILGSNLDVNISFAVTNFSQSNISQVNLIYQKTLSQYSWHLEGIAPLLYFACSHILSMYLSRTFVFCTVTAARIGQERCPFEGDAK